MRWHPIEVDLLGALEAIARAPGPRFLVGPAGHEDAAGIAALVAREARAWREVERDVASRRLAAAEEEARALEGGVEADRAGRAGARSLPGHEEALEKIAGARRALAEHEAALARIASGAEERRAREAMAAFEIRPRADLDALKAAAGEGQVVELFADGYALESGRAAQLEARRRFLGLPAGRDWS